MLLWGGGTLDRLKDIKCNLFCTVCEKQFYCADPFFAVCNHSCEHCGASLEQLQTKENEVKVHVAPG